MLVYRNTSYVYSLTVDNKFALYAAEKDQRIAWNELNLNKVVEEDLSSGSRLHIRYVNRFPWEALRETEKSGGRLARQFDEICLLWHEKWA